MCLNTGNISFRVVDTCHSLSVFSDYQEGGGIVPSAGDDAGLGTMQWSGYNAPNHSLANGAWDLPNDGAVIMTRRLMTGTQLPPSSGARTFEKNLQKILSIFHQGLNKASQFNTSYLCV